MEIVIDQRKLIALTGLTIICLALTEFALNNSYERLVILNILKLILYTFWTRLLFIESSFQMSTSRPFLFIGVGCWILGIVFKIQHWSIWFYLMLIGGALISIPYSIHFMKESKKTILDILKLIWLLAFIVIHLLMHKHFGNELISLIPDILFCVTIIKFTQQNKRDFILMF